MSNPTVTPGGRRERRRSARVALPVYALIAGERAPVTDIGVRYARISWGGKVPPQGTPIAVTLVFAHPSGESSASLWAEVSRVDGARREFVLRFPEPDHRFMQSLLELLDALQKAPQPRIVRRSGGALRTAE